MKPAAEALAARVLFPTVLAPYCHRPVCRHVDPIARVSGLPSDPAFLNAIVRDDTGTCVNPFMVLNELESGLHHHSLITREEIRLRSVTARYFGALVPWTTPDGTTPLVWAAAVPMYTFADLIQVLAPNGRGTDGDSRAPPVPKRTATVPYAELHCHSNFSFLDGASHPEELVEEAARLGLTALAWNASDYPKLA